jgi:hypothetical protein
LINVTAMSLDGLRAWIGEVERKLVIRTRVFLILVAIAIGAAGAGIYLAIQAEDNDNGGSSSGDQIQAIEERVDALGAGASPTSSLESRLSLLEQEVHELSSEAAKPGSGGGSEETGEAGKE